MLVSQSSVAVCEVPVLQELSRQALGLSSEEAIPVLAPGADGARFVLPPGWARLDEPSPAFVFAPSSDSDYDAILIDLLMKASPGTKILAIMPISFTRSEMAMPWRQQMVEQALPLLVVTWDHPLTLTRQFWPDDDVESDVLVLEKGGRRPVFFFNVKSETTPEELLEKTRGLRGGKWPYGEDLFSVKQLDPRKALTFDKYQPKLGQHGQVLSKRFGGSRPLREIATILAGDASFEEGGTKSSGRPCLLLQAEMIREDGDLRLDNAECYVSAQGKLQVGDICLVAVRTDAHSKLRTIVIKAQHPPLRAASDLLIIRIGLDSQPALDYAVLLQSYLGSEKAASLCPSVNDGAVTRASLQELPVPVPDDAFWEAWKRLECSRAEFSCWALEAERQKQLLFEFDSPDHLHSSIWEVGRHVRLAQRAADLTRKLSNRVRRYFPYPLAVRYSHLESSFQDSEGLQNALEAAEVLTQYLSILALVESTAQGLSIGKWDGLLKAWAQGTNRGLSFGDYFAILQEISESPVWNQKTDQLHFQEVQQFFSNPDVTRDLRSIMESRNDAAHLRRSRGSKLVEQFQQTRECLERLYQASEFLAEWPLVFVEKTFHDSLYRSTEIQMRELRGDQPMVSVERSKVGKSDVEAGSLYVRSHGGELFLLRPLVVWAECSECKLYESFCIDKVDTRQGVCECKSLELGHSLTSASVFQAFQKSHLERAIP